MEIRRLIASSVRATAPAGKEARVGRLHASPACTRQSVPVLKTSPELIRLAVLLYARFPLSLRNVEDMLAERAWTSAIRRCANQT